MKIRHPYLRFIETPEGGEGETGGATPPAAPETTLVPPKPGPAVPAAEPKADDELGDAGKRALQSERDARKVAEAKVKEYEDAQKTQVERDAEKNAELVKTSTENATKVLRYEAAEQAGLPLAAASRLQGSTLDELVKDAEVLKALGIGKTEAAHESPGTPQPDLSQGRTGGNTAPKNLNEAVSNHYDT